MYHTAVSHLAQSIIHLASPEHSHTLRCAGLRPSIALGIDRAFAAAEELHRSRFTNSDCGAVGGEVMMS